MAASLATMILDADLTPVDASPAALELIGGSLDDLRRLEPGSLAPDPVEAESQAALRDVWRDEGAPDMTGEATIRRLDGEKVRIRFGLTPMDGGRYLAVLEPVAAPLEQPTAIYTAGQVLAEWRAAERRMAEVPRDSEEGRRIQAEIEVFRRRYQDVFRSRTDDPAAG